MPRGPGRAEPGRGLAAGRAPGYKRQRPAPQLRVSLGGHGAAGCRLRPARPFPEELPGQGRAGQRRGEDTPPSCPEAAAELAALSAGR